MSTKQTLQHYHYAYLSIRQRGLVTSAASSNPFWVILFFLSILSTGSIFAQNPIAGNQGFQILSEGNLTFTGYTHVHGALGIGGNLTLNCNGVLAEICMDGVSSYVFPGDGSTTTGLLVKGGITWTNGGAKVMGGKYMHIGSSTGCIQSDNGSNMATQVLPTGGTYNQAKRIEGALDQTPSPSPFQTVSFDFTTLFNTYRANSQGMAACTNNVQLYNASNVAISGNTVSSAQNVQINSLANGVNVLNLTSASLNNMTELKFNASALPSASKLLVINVPLTGNFTWNNCNMPGLSGSGNGAYIIWNFSGNTSYNLTVNTASLVIGTVFAPNHNLIKSGTGDIDGGIFAKSIILGLGEVHLYNFNGSVPLCSSCSNLTSPGTIGANQSGCTGFDPSAITETAAPSGGSGTIQYQWQSSSDNATWTDISGATSQTYDPSTLASTTYFRRGVRRSGCSSYIYSASVTMTVSPAISIVSQPVSATISSGGTQTLTVTATGGSPSLTYQWQSSSNNITFTNISGATSSTYTTPALTSTTYYKVIVAATGSGCGSVTSATATVTVGSNGGGLGCANFLGNPEFDYSTNRWGLWANTGNTATFNINTASQLSGANSAFIDLGTVVGGAANAWQVQLMQGGFPVYAGTSYTVTFTAKAASNRNITVSLLQTVSPYTTYASQNVAITTTKNTYTLTFPITTTDLNSVGLYFMLGESNADVYLDNIVWSEKCGTQVCTNGTGHNLISNTEMDFGTNNWGLGVQGGASATYSINNTSQLSGTNSVFVNIATATGTNWHVQLVQSGHTVEAGKSYRISFKAKATANRNMYVSLQQNYSPWSEIDGQTVALTTTSQTYTLTFTANMDDSRDVGLYFHLGESNADVYIDDVEWAELCNTEICNNGYDDDSDGYVDAADSDCAVCDAPTYGFQNGALKSGTALSPGAVYRFSNVTPGTDVEVKINSFSHSDVTISSMDLSAYDAPGGYNLAFQPQVLYGWANANGTFDSPGERYVDFTFSFFDAGTNNPQEFSKMVLSAIDVDGDNGSVMEFIQTSGFASYETNSPTALTLSGSLKAKSDISNATNIDETALDHMVSFVYEHKTGINVRYGADWNGASQTFADNRLNSMYFKCYSLNTQVSCPTVTVAGQYSVCTGVSQTLTSSTSGGIGTKTYQWQSSTDNQTWTNISGATSQSYNTGAITAKTYYRLGVSFSGNASCGVVYSDDFPVTPGACVENCSNGVDDNGNGLVDGADLDCVTLCPTGSISFQRWNNIGGSNITDLTSNASYPNSPSETGVLTSFDGPDNYGDNYGTRVFGYITPTTTGNYSFNLTGDDYCQLYLSTNASPTNKSLIAAVNGWTNPAEYNKYSSQTSSPYYLQAGRNYYIELFQKEGGGADHFQVYWKTPSNSNWSIIPGANLRPANCTEICTNTLDDDGDGLADCSDSECQPVITAQPNGATICTGGTHALSVTASGTVTYQWQSSANNSTFTNISGATSASYTTPALTTTTYYRVLVTKSGCAVPSNSATVTVVADPSITTQPASATVCSGLTHTLSVVAAGGTPSLTYQWQMSLDNIIFTNVLGATSASYTTPALLVKTYYRVIVSAGGNGCGSITSSVATISMGVALTPAITGNTNICAGSSTALSTTGGGTYLWSTGATTSAIVVVPASTTTYTVTVTNITGCTGTAQATVTVNPLPVANAGTDATICSGLSANLNATVSGGTSPYTYNWSNSLGTGQSKSVSPAATTTYTVTVTSASGCTSTDQVVVNVNPSPALTVNSNVTICKDASTTLTLSTTGGTTPYTYAWSNGLGNGTSATISPTATTTYTVTVTGANGCTATNQATVTINAKPVANAGADVAICTLAGTTLTASASGAPSPYSYYWNNGVSTASQPVSPGATTTYTVTVTSSNGCFSTDQVVVTVQACSENCGNGADDDGDGLADCSDSDCGPSANAGSDMSICPGNTAFLSVGVTGGSQPYTYAWSNGLGSGATKVVTPTATTTYTVTVTSASGCTSTDQVKVTVMACGENCTNGIDDDGDGLVDCADPDCSGVTAPVLMDDNYATCPGMDYSNRVTYNDDNLNNPTFSISTQPTHGTVTIDGTGKFFYIPNGFDCVTDHFTYEVCNQSTGCCETANVTIVLSDNSAPQLMNVPADITISCDDAVPSASIVTGFDQCPGIYMDYTESSSQNQVGACGSYVITRTWTATDFCGNATSDNQLINVLDQTKPEIFQLYTLEGGSNMVAGYSQRVTNEWKYVRFPITFKATPVVLASIGTNADPTAVAVQVRNVSMQGFELRVREEEIADGAHGNENVSWIAIDPAFNNGNLKWESGTLANVNETASSLSFKQSYTGTPLFFASSMTNAQSDPATLRLTNLTSAGVDVLAQEEQSADTEATRVNETIGYLAFNANSPLVDKAGSVFGEAGNLNVTNAWATVTLSRAYTKPVVIVGGVSSNDGQPVTLRVRNITGNKFEVRLQEWNYLDGSHPAEAISWLVVEGSVPGEESFYCKTKGSGLKPNVSIFAVDNCDDLVNFAYNASDSRSENGLVQNHTWTAIDDCGNTTLINRSDTCQVAALKVKAILNGALLNPTTPGKMRDDLRVKSFLPTIEPYTGMNSFSYVQYQGHGNNNGNNGNNDDDDNEVMVTICHEPGTDEQSTIEVELEKLAYHISIGDHIGECDIAESDKVTICHKPGTSAQKTLVVSLASLLAHLAHGDVIGTCSGSGNEMGTGATTAQYKTIADGEWTSSSTWQNGLVPPTNVSNATISVMHKLRLPNSGLKLQTGTKLYVTGGSLRFDTNTLEVQNAQVYFDRSVLDMPAINSSLMVSNSSAIVKFTDCQVNIGKKIQNSGGKIKMDHVALVLGDNYENNGGTDSLVNVCATINGNITNSLLGKFYLSSTKLRLPEGNFTNLGTVTGGNLKLLIENGSLLNTGLGWGAPLLQFCISGTIGLTGSLLPAVEDCNNISNLFNPCDCYDLPTSSNNSGSGNTGIVSNVVTEMNKGKSYGNGEMDDAAATLAVSGDEAVVDWLMVEIRNMNNEAEVLGYQSVVLKKNGQVMGENGDSLLVFPGLDEGDYYVTIRHRNHLGETTNDPIFLSIIDPPLVDFTDTSMPVKGGTAAGRLVNGKRSLWSGDFNGDGKVIYQGPFNDVFTLFSKVVGNSENTTNLANFIVSGYKTEDFNLDGKTIYQGPGNDRSYLLLNTILASPSNVTLLANFIVSDFIP